MGFKLEVYSYLVEFIKRLTTPNVIVIGDFNIAHKEVDLAILCLHSRKEVWLINRLITRGFADSFRIFNQESGHYSWFPYVFNAKERSLGWRMDYAFVSKDLKSKIKNSSILKV